MTGKVWAVIMAGGSGTRFWPASRMRRPKQLLPLGGGTRSLLAETVARIAPVVPIERILIVTAATLAEATRKELPDLPPENLLAEPAPRNTAPCIGWANRVIAARDRDAIIAVLPSDHHVADEAAFAETVKRAIEVAKVRDLATIGIAPTRPDTGFGYIEKGAAIEDPPQAGRVSGAGKNAFDVARFVEKPDLVSAQQYLTTGKYLWNGGMFFFRAGAMEKAIRAHMPELAKGLDEMGETEVSRIFPTLPSISVDYGIVEKIDPSQIGVVPGDFGWSDVGSWESAWELASKDANGNAMPDDSVAVDARGNLVRSKKMVALVGVEDLVVVETDDAILVMPRKRAQDVRAVVDALKSKGKNELL